MYERGENLRHRTKYFEKKRRDERNQFHECQSKIIQINKEEIYVIGGDESGQLISQVYNVYSNCWNVNFYTGELIKTPDLVTGRLFHSVCLVGHLIFLVGGIETDGMTAYTTE